MAHHSGAQFDRGTTKTVEVIVTRFDFRNPHAWIYAKSMDAGSADWEFELMDVANLFRQGWRKISVVPGVKLKVVYNPLRREGSPGGWLISVTDPKGKPCTTDLPPLAQRSIDGPPSWATINGRHIAFVPCFLFLSDAAVGLGE